jgi:hypothetical protein
MPIKLKVKPAAITLFPAHSELLTNARHKTEIRSKYIDRKNLNFFASQ